MRRLVLVAITVACGPPPAAPQHVVSNQAPPSDAALAEPSVDIAGTPAGPFRSAESFCQRWEAKNNEGVEERERKCSGGSGLEEDCESECGFRSHCAVTAMDASSLGPFRSAQLVELWQPCGPGDCYLALGTARGIWLASEVSQCSTGEGFSASLTTKSLGAEQDALVWHYEHDFGTPPDVQSESPTLRCRATRGAPECVEDP
jgi:hypothetical protein